MSDLYFVRVGRFLKIGKTRDITERGRQVRSRGSAHSDTARTERRLPTETTHRPAAAQRYWSLGCLSKSDQMKRNGGPLAKQPTHLRDRWRAVDKMVRGHGRQPLCLGLAKDGHPKHPLMLAYDSPLFPWRPQ